VHAQMEVHVHGRGQTEQGSLARRRHSLLEEEEWRY
jgi:hypothetical protein